MKNKEQYTLGFTTRIRRLNDLLLDTGKVVYSTMGLEIEPNWHMILLLLEEKQSLSVCEIAGHIKFSHPAIIKIIKKMEDKGYVKKKKDKNDNRKQMICLSEKAIEKMPELKKKWNVIADVLSDYVSENFILELDILETNLKSNVITKAVYDKVKINSNND